VVKDFSILFIGTPSPFATVPLKALASNYRLAGIIESAPRGFKFGSIQTLPLFLQRWFDSNSLYRLAKQFNCPYFFYSPENTAGLLTFLHNTHPNLGCVASMNQLLPAAAIHILPLGFINMHPSLLPDLPGPHVWTWLYYYNEHQSGVTIHQIDEKEDHGNILKQSSFPIFSGMSPSLLVETSIGLGTKLLLEALAEIRSGQSHPIPNSAVGPIHRARRIKPGEMLFPYRDWDIEHTYHFLQGVRPWYSPFSPAQHVWGWIDWQAVSFKSSNRLTSTDQDGSIGLDAHGFYFAHPQGKIRLRPEINGLRLIITVLLMIAVINFLFTRNP
jgi:methionyl-tRNA formyltransferase